MTPPDVYAGLSAGYAYLLNASQEMNLELEGSDVEITIVTQKSLLTQICVMSIESSTPANLAKTSYEAMLQDKKSYTFQKFALLKLNLYFLQIL